MALSASGAEGRADGGGLLVLAAPGLSAAGGAPGREPSRKARSSRVSAPGAGGRLDA